MLRMPRTRNRRRTTQLPRTVSLTLMTLLTVSPALLLVALPIGVGIGGGIIMGLSLAVVIGFAF